MSSARRRPCSLAVATALLVLAGCGDGGAGDADGPPDDVATGEADDADAGAEDGTSDPAEDGAADGADACDLLDGDELAEVTGRDFDAGAPDPVLGAEVGTDCLWQDDDGTGFVSTVLITDADDDVDAGYAEIRDLAEEGGGIEDVADLGREAHRVGGSVTVLLDDALIVVSVGGLDDEAQVLELTERAIANR